MEVSLLFHGVSFMKGHPVSSQDCKFTYNSIGALVLKELEESLSAHKHYEIKVKDEDEQKYINEINALKEFTEDQLSDAFNELMVLPWKFIKRLNLYDVINIDCFSSKSSGQTLKVEAFSTSTFATLLSEYGFILEKREFLDTNSVMVSLVVCDLDVMSEFHPRVTGFDIY
jgi:hypothetical protein